MSLYQVLQHPLGVEVSSDESGARFIQERFSWSAALIPPLWAMVHGLWLELLIWITAMLLLVGVDRMLGEEVSFWLYVLCAIFIGFEAANIRASALRRKGFRLAGDIIAPSEDIAEMTWLKNRQHP